MNTTFNSELLIQKAASAHSTGNLEQADSLYQQLLFAYPDYAEGHHLYGILLQQRGDLVRSESFIRKAISLAASHQKYCNLGIVLEKLGRREEAITCYMRAIEIKPDYFLANFNLGNAYQADGKLIEAINSYKAALIANNNYAEAYFNMGNALKQRGDLGKAIEAYQAAVTNKPDFSEAYFNLANCYQEQGMPDIAIKNYKHALQINPDYVEAHNSLIFSMDMLPTATVAEIQAERRYWVSKHTSHCSETPRLYSSLSNHKEKLRVGYVSADFRQHSAMNVFSPMLQYYDKQRFEVFAYSNAPVVDSHTHMVMEWVDHFRMITSADDHTLSSIIVNDGIDILVDLSGYSQGNRLLMFAQKPAPIQITAWGCIGGTGLSAMDYFFADKVVVPENERCLYAEEVIDLPCVAGYFPIEELPPLNSLPFASARSMTFGSFNRLHKINTETLDLWVQVLNANPSSRLLMKAFELEQKCERDRIMGFFKNRGISGDRITLMGKTTWYEHMKAYNLVDVSLDPFPHCGGVTSLESLIMGVPVVTLAWPTLIGRLTTSFLQTLGLEKWVAQSPEEYIQISTSFSMNANSLNGLRLSLRDQMQSSLLANPKLYVTEIEKHYKNLWLRYAAKLQGDLN